MRPQTNVPDKNAGCLNDENYTPRVTTRMGTYSELSIFGSVELAVG